MGRKPPETEGTGRLNDLVAPPPDPPTLPKEMGKGQATVRSRVWAWVPSEPPYGAIKAGEGKKMSSGSATNPRAAWKTPVRSRAQHFFFPPYNSRSPYNLGLTLGVYFSWGGGLLHLSNKR